MSYNGDEELRRGEGGATSVLVVAIAKRGVERRAKISRRHRLNIRSSLRLNSSLRSSLILITPVIIAFLFLTFKLKLTTLVTLLVQFLSKDTHK